MFGPIWCPNQIIKARMRMKVTELKQQSEEFRVGTLRLSS
jgi:hypothetical protein